MCSLSKGREDDCVCLHVCACKFSGNDRVEISRLNEQVTELAPYSSADSYGWEGRSDGPLHETGIWQVCDSVSVEKLAGTPILTSII